MNPILIHTTFSTVEEARKIIKHLLDQRLIACASLIPNVESHYIWKGKTERSSEVKAILKTDMIKFNAVENVILIEGSYDVPEILACDVCKGHEPYLDWLKNQIN